MGGLDNLKRFLVSHFFHDDILLKLCCREYGDVPVLSINTVPEPSPARTYLSSPLLGMKYPVTKCSSLP